MVQASASYVAPSTMDKDIIIIMRGKIKGATDEHKDQAKKQLDSYAHINS